MTDYVFPAKKLNRDIPLHRVTPIIPCFTEDFIGKAGMCGAQHNDVN
jgi:hypothetical protein